MQYDTPRELKSGSENEGAAMRICALRTFPADNNVSAAGDGSQRTISHSVALFFPVSYSFSFSHFRTKLLRKTLPSIPERKA